MVRFKNRHLLVEFLSPQSLSSTVTISAPTSQSDLDALNPNGVDNADGDEEEEDDDDDTDLPLLPTVPFLVPITDESTRLKLGDESGSTVYRAIKQNILDVFGDEGWGRVSSSFKVIYHSPLSTLTILRVSRAHYRTLWAALTLLRSISDQPLLPRVVAVSGTIKKLQNRAIAYHRAVAAQVLAVHLAEVDKGDTRGREEVEGRLEGAWGREEEQMRVLQE